MQTLQRVVSNYPTMNKANVTDIVVLGGYNDVSTNLTESQCLTAMQAFVTYVSSLFDNAIVHFGCIGFDYANLTTQNSIFSYAGGLYPRCCSKANIKYYGRFQFILLNSAYVYYVSGDANSDFHPNTTGCQQVAAKLYEYLQNGEFDVREGYPVYNSWVYSDNGTVYITPKNSTTIFSVTEAASLSYPFNTWVDVKDLTHADYNLWGSAANLTPLYGAVQWYNYDTHELVASLEYRLMNHKLQFNNVSSLTTFTPPTGNAGFVIEPVTINYYMAY